MATSSSSSAGNGLPPSLLAWVSAHKKQLLAGSSAAAAAYLVWKAYNSESAANLGKYRQAFKDSATVVSTVSSTARLVVSDLYAFLSSDDDEVPRSLRQLNKLLQSQEVQASIRSTTTSLGDALSSVLAHSSTSSSQGSNSEPVLHTIIDAVLSDRGRTLVGMAVGLATKNATATFCEYLERMQRPTVVASSSDDPDAVPVGGLPSSIETLVSVLASEQGERIMSLLITKSIKTAVSTYVEATTGYNYYDDMMSSIAKQEHRDAVSDIMSRVTAAFCRELVAVYRKASRASASGVPAQQQLGGSGTSLGHSSHNSSTTSIISLAGHTLVAPSQPSSDAGAASSLPPRPLNRRFSSDEASLRQQAGACSSALPHLNLPHKHTNGVHASKQAVAAALLPSPSSSSSNQWFKPLVDMAKERELRSLALDVVCSATREATKSTWETLISSAGQSLGLPGRVDRAAAYKAYMLLTVCVSLFMYAVSPRVIAA